MASSSDTVPPTLLEKYSSGSRMDSPTMLCAAKCTTASTPSGRRALVVERRIYAPSSVLPPPEILRRNGIRPGSGARTDDGTVYLFAFDTLEARVKAWDRFNADQDWCVLRNAGTVALQEVQV